MASRTYAGSCHCGKLRAWGSPVKPASLRLRVPVIIADGRNNYWQHPPAETRHL